MAKTKKPKAKRPRKTLAQKLDGIMLDALASYGKHSLLCGQKGWLPFPPKNCIGYGYAREAIRRALREARRG